ncbi:uncharacterized protein LOC118421066 [Branchiostoma floridae]|uniref:Uncharacterized protein LOC118421066 n=1 Tax=Branchiostoma floridae TaxID=7739 RepID=A0A9J7MZ67_BRAFL|nr:uncharacterized protein LOC118421066 [Branchiostoma floridae]
MDRTCARVTCSRTYVTSSVTWGTYRKQTTPWAAAGPETGPPSMEGTRLRWKMLYQQMSSSHRLWTVSSLTAETFRRRHTVTSPVQVRRTARRAISPAMTGTNG